MISTDDGEVPYLEVKIINMICSLNPSRFELLKEYVERKQKEVLKQAKDRLLKSYKMYEIDTLFDQVWRELTDELLGGLK